MTCGTHRHEGERTTPSRSCAAYLPAYLGTHVGILTSREKQLHTSNALDIWLALLPPWMSLIHAFKLAVTVTVTVTSPPPPPSLIETRRVFISTQTSPAFPLFQPWRVGVETLFLGGDRDGTETEAEAGTATRRDHMRDAQPDDL